MAAEVVGSVLDRELLQQVVAGRAAMSDRLEDHMSPPLPLIGGGETLSALLALLEQTDAVVVLEDGKPQGVVTRQDVLGFMARTGR
jgi:cystathionine beta-synthase